MVSTPIIRQEIKGEHNIVTGTGDINITYNLPPANSQERRQQLILLDRVEQFWIDGVLERSVQDTVLVDLSKESLPEAVERLWELEFPGHPSQIIPSERRIADIFDEVDRFLLILGEPGSGKTTSLLELARELLNRAREDPSQPIPVVFNLSTWTEKGQSLFHWLVEQLRSQYYVPKRIGGSWLEKNRLLLLLDGLDEVKQDNLPACVEAINKFGQEYGLGGLALCSRLEEYKALPIRLKLNAAVCLQPLALDQVEDYLTRAGSKLATLRTTLKEDTVLRSLARSPLMLNVMSIAYQDISAEALTDKELDTVDLHRRHLLETYVERMFNREKKAHRLYTRDKTVFWLSWLAKMMAKHSQSIFFIDQLQPSWLSKRGTRLLYMLFSRLFGGLIFGFSVAIIWGLNRGLIAGLIGGLIVSIIDTLKFERSDKPKVTKKVSASWGRLLIIFIYGFILGLAAVLTGLLIGPILGELFKGLIGLLIGGLIGGLIGATIMPFIARSYKSKAVINKTTSWSKKINIFIYGMILGLCGGVTFGLNLTQIVGLIGGLTGGVIGGVIVGFIDALRFEQREKSQAAVKLSQPLQRLIHIFIYLLILGFCGGFIFGLTGAVILGLIGGIIWGLRGSRRTSTTDIQTVETLSWSWPNSRKGGIRGLIIGLIGGLPLGLLLGFLMLILGGGHLVAFLVLV